MLNKLSEVTAPLRFRPIVLVGVLYSPIGILPALPVDGVYLEALARFGFAYLLLVYVVSTLWFARQPGAHWVDATVRHVGSAALVGALASAMVTLVARVAGLEQVYPSGSGMQFTIQECYSCEAPWDTAARVIWYQLRFVIAATLLAPLIGAVGRAIEVRPAVQP